MGNAFGGGNKPSAEQLKLQKEQSLLSEKQRQQIDEQNSRLRQEESQANIVADRERAKRISSSKASRSRRSGRGSLIATSELGVKSNLG